MVVTVEIKMGTEVGMRIKISRSRMGNGQMDKTKDECLNNEEHDDGDKD